MQIAFGRAAEDRGDFQEAVAAYTAALKQDSKRAEVLQRLAVVHDRMGKFQESSTYYARALAAAPGNPEIFCDKGYSLYLQRKFRDAEVCLRQAIALQPDLNRAHVNLGLVMARQGKSDESLTEFRKGGCSPAIAHQNLAFVMTTERRWPEAQNQYKLALAADPQSEIARKRLNELSPLIAKLESSEVKIATDPKILKATYEKQAARTIPVAKVKK